MMQQKIGIMLDIESLDLGPRAVVLQFAALAYPLDDPETEIRRIDVNLPAQPQIALGRTVSFDTVRWWAGLEGAAGKRLIESSGNDMEELLAHVRQIRRKLGEIIEQAGGKQNVEIWAKGPQFDVVNMETLFADCAQDVPWSYDSVMDLRTTMRLAGIHTENVDSSGITPHVAIEDCRFQVRCYIEAMKHLRANS